MEIGPVYIAKNDTPYTVIHKQMNLDGEGYTEKEREVFTGETDTEVTPSVKTYTGFKSPEEVTVNIDGDGSRVVEYLYERNKYNLNAEDTYLDESSTSNGDYYYNTEITLKALNRAGYDFVKWDNGELSQEYTFKIKKDVVIKPIYKARKDTVYKVIHKQMNLDGEGYTEKEREVFTGETDTEVTPSVKTYTGFKSPEEVTVNIDGDGSRVVEYLYERNKYNLTINDLDNIDIDNSNAPGDYYYGTEIKVVAMPKVGYDFIWDNGVESFENTFIMTKDVLLIPKYTPREDITYKVIHKLMNSDGETYYIKDEFIYHDGVADGLKVPIVNIYEGFTSPEAKEVIINADGSTVVEYLYTRNKYTFNIEDSEYVDLDNSTEVGDYYYGTEVYALAKDRVGYTFVGWNNGEVNKLTKFNLIQNTAIKPIYKPNEDTPYKVIHKKMNLDGETYTVVDEENLVGTTDTPVTPQTKIYQGFTSPEAVTVNIDGDGSRVVEYLYTRNKYTLTVLDKEYVNLLSTEPGEYYYETEINLYSVDRFGYEFIGWSDGGTKEHYTFKLLDDIEIGPVYSANTDTPYKVIHKKMNLDGTYTQSDIDLLVGTTDDTVIPERKLYEHYVIPEGQELKIKGNGKSSIEYLYEREKYKLSYLDKDKEYIDLNVSTKEGKYYYETEITLKAKDKAHYTFKGWNNGILSQEFSFNITGDTNLWPLYEANKYTVIFHKNRETATGTMSNQSLTYDSSEELSKNEFSLAGYTFTSWNTKPDGSGTSYDDEESVLNITENDDITLYAQWKANTDTPYKVIHKKMNLDGSTYTIEETENLKGTTDEAVIPKVKSYTGFTSPSTNSLTIKGDGTSELIYLYTRNKYTISYNGNGGTSGGSVVKYYGDTLGSLPSTSRTGYTYKGWYTQASSGSQISSSTTVTGNNTYYAHWKDETNPTVKVTVYKYNGNNANGVGDLLISTNTYTSNATIYVNSNNWVNYGVLYKIEFSDNGSGISSRVWKWNPAGNYSQNANYTGGSSNPSSPAYVSLTGAGFRQAQFIATDEESNSVTITVVAKIDTTAPTCGTAGNSSTTWTNQNRTINQACNDNGQSGCKQTTYSTTYSTTTTTGSVRIWDNANNYRDCSYNVYVDKSTPTAPTIAGGIDLTWTVNDWHSSNKVIWITKDSTATSGINYYEYCVNTTWENTNGCSWQRLGPVSDASVAEYEIAFDPAYYLQANADMPNAFKGNVDDMFNHFKSSGIREGRPSSQLFDIGTYRSSNPDVINAFGSDYNSVVNHFMEYGMIEGRVASPYFNYTNYKSILNNYFGNDARMYWHHAYYYGIAEGRNLGTSNKYLRKAQDITTHGTRFTFFRAVSNAGTVGAISNSRATQIGVYSQDSVCGTSTSTSNNECTSSACCGTSTKWATTTKAGTPVSTCSTTYNGTCVQGTTSGGNCSCRYSYSYQAANTCTSSCCGTTSNSSVNTCWHE